MLDDLLGDGSGGAGEKKEEGLDRVVRADGGGVRGGGVDSGVGGDGADAVMPAEEGEVALLFDEFEGGEEKAVAKTLLHMKISTHS